MSKMNTKGFIRQFTNIEKLKDEAFFKEILLPEIKQGNIFPAVRKDEVHFYFCGGCLCKYETTFTFDQGYFNYKYSSKSSGEYACNANKCLKKFINENNLTYKEFYHQICICIKNRFKDKEREAISKSYKYTFADDDTYKFKKAVILDVEIRPNIDEDWGSKKVDLLLLKNQILQFVEVKLTDGSYKLGLNDRMQEAKDSIESVKKQMHHYNSWISSEDGPNICEQYKNYINIINDLFGTQYKPDNLSLNKTVKLFFINDKEKEITEEMKENLSKKIEINTNDIKIDNHMCLDINFS